ncbi:MAG: hypothetical protein KA765_12975 [Thermoflexales bacterium]|nr:hypothetical protein [Thermoflexales bacterium]
MRTRGGNHYTFDLIPKTRVTSERHADALGIGVYVIVEAYRDRAGTGWLARSIVIIKSSVSTRRRPRLAQQPTCGNSDEDLSTARGHQHPGATHGHEPTGCGNVEQHYGRHLCRKMHGLSRNYGGAVASHVSKCSEG